MDEKNFYSTPTSAMTRPVRNIPKGSKYRINRDPNGLFFIQERFLYLFWIPLNIAFDDLQTAWDYVRCIIENESAAGPVLYLDENGDET